jgi:hypothetical protein
MASTAEITEVFAELDGGPGDGEFGHGYPPPVRPPGTAVTAYCGVPMIVRGESAKTPPPDTCPECVAIWRHFKAGHQ